MNTLSTIEKTIHLRKVPLFETLLGEELLAISNIAQQCDFRKNDIIFLENAPGTGLFIVVAGRVAVFKGDARAKDRKVIQYFLPLDYFGEMSLFDDIARSLNAAAEDDSTCLFIPKEAFLDLIDEVPAIALSIIRVLSKRLRQANLKL
jgi:CRP/FNR family transcriptional regulator